MLCEICVCGTCNTEVIDVLILVLLEYALRVYKTIVKANDTGVLILVLLEYALRDNVLPFKKIIFVLILVLLEYALRVFIYDSTETPAVCLNPCFTGICSASRASLC